MPTLTTAKDTSSAAADTTNVGDTRSKFDAPPHIDIEISRDEKNWYEVFEIIHHHVMQLKKLVRLLDRGSTTNTKYLLTWSSLYNDVTEHKKDVPDIEWRAIAAIYMPG